MPVAQAIRTLDDTALIVGPLIFGTFIVFTRVHVVTGKARHCSLLVTRRLQQTVVFSSANANHAIGPELMLPEIWIALWATPRHDRIGKRVANPTSCLPVETQNPLLA